MVLAFTGQRGKAGDGAEVLFMYPPVIISSVKSLSKGRRWPGWARLVVQPVRQDHEPQRHGLLGDRMHVVPHHTFDPFEQLAVTAGCTPARWSIRVLNSSRRHRLAVELGLHVVRQVARCAAAAARPAGRGGGSPRRRSGRRRTGPPAPGFHAGNRRRQSARRRANPAACSTLQRASRRLGEFAHEPGHQHRVARIVELELVDAHQLVAAEGSTVLRKRQGADEVGVLNERAESLGPGLRATGTPAGGSCRRRSRRRGRSPPGNCPSCRTAS